MSDVDICICTFRRAHIADTLRSLAQLALPGGVAVHVIVADNDETPSAKEIVEDTAATLDLSLTYIHAPARNISIARNACLDAATAPLVAFIDDDEIATPQWLSALLWEIKDNDVVLGPVDAVYPRNDWMKAADFHSTRPVFVGGKIITGYSCNVMFHREAPVFTGLRFRPELGRSGGEDTAFFSAAYARSARIAYAPQAIVTETVSPNRAKFSWLLKRRFRAGQTHGLLLLEKPGASRLSAIIKAGAKAGLCFTMALLFVFLSARSRYWLLRGALHGGVVARLLGADIIEQY